MVLAESGEQDGAGRKDANTHAHFVNIALDALDKRNHEGRPRVGYEQKQATAHLPKETQWSLSILGVQWWGAHGFWDYLQILLRKQLPAEARGRHPVADARI